jgi:diacylglycerol kinase (ATP)
MPGHTIVIFCNPGSGRGRGIIIASQLQATLIRAGFHIIVHTQHPAIKIATENETGFHWSHVSRAYAIIVIGGDGTLRAVVEQLLLQVHSNPLPPILFIGLGTANLMQKHLQLKYLSDDIGNTVIELLHKRRVKYIDVAALNERPFLLMVSCGFDAAVVHALTRVRRGPIRKWSYVMPVLNSLHSSDFIEVSVLVDNQRVHQHAPALVYVGNVREYGTGFAVLDQAISDDGLLDVCILPCDSVAKLMQIAIKTSMGAHHDLPGVIYTRGKNITIESVAPVPVQMDGDAAGFTPADIRLLDRRAGFIVA